MMIPQNTFLIKQTEKVDSEKMFVSLLCPQLLEYIKKNYFDTVLMINSAPGGGKTTLLKTFSPEILMEIQKNVSKKEQYEDIYKLLAELDVIDDKKIKLISIIISCARENYSLIDDVYEGGKAVQIFFQLISLRICTKLLDAIKRFNALDNLERISFKRLPDSWRVLLSKRNNGEFLFRWAFEEEGKLCNHIDNMIDDIDGSLMFNSLSVLQLFENGNVLLDGQPIVQRLLVTFDDLNALTSNQRDELRNSIFRLRPNISIWMTQRLIALSETEILGTEGRLHREYIEINLDYIAKENKKFYSNLIDVANRRVAMVYRDEEMDEKLESMPYDSLENKVSIVVDKIKKKVNKLNEKNQNYTAIIDYINFSELTSIERAKKLRVLQILIERQMAKPQAVLPFVPVITTEEYEKEYSKLKGVGEYYLCLENKLPIYYGIRTLQHLSSYNIEQFLEFAGEIFEARIALEFTSKKRVREFLSAKEQEHIIEKYAEEKWNNIKKSFSEGDIVQHFLEKIAQIGIEGMCGKRASYSSGTFTGIGLDEEKIKSMLSNDDYKRCLHILRMCIANNYLKCWDVKQGSEGQLNKVFYLNRWICVKFKLPLSYGGWKPISIQDLYDMIISGEK